MATAVQQRRGTDVEHDDGDGFIGLEGEITVDTTNDTIRVHDNSTKGGHRLAKYSELGATITASDESSDVECFPVFTTAATGALAPKTDASAYTYNAGTGTLSVTSLNVSGTVTADGLTLGDNEKIAINSNLEIYTNGNDSYIQEKDASGALFIEGQNFFGRDKDQKNRLSWDNDNVRLYFKNDTASTINAGLATEVTAGESGERFRTQAGGIDVTGTVIADGFTGSQTISNYVTDTAISVTEFASHAGKKIIYTGAASTISLPNVVAADIGKSWTIVNAGTGVITVDVDASGTAQQVRHAHAGGVNTSTTDRTIAIGGVVEIICIAEDSSGITNSSDKPNYLIYGGGVI